MLRKFFHSGGASDGTASSMSLDAAKRSEAESHGNRDTKFAEMVMRLERFEGDSAKAEYVRCTEGLTLIVCV